MSRKRRESTRAGRQPTPPDSAASTNGLLGAPWPDRAWGRAALCLAAALVLYGPGLRNGFTLDDHAYLADNPEIRSLSGVAYLAFAPLAEGETLRGHLYRPFSALVEHLVGRFFGFSPLPFHLLGVVLYGLVALVLWRLLDRLVPPAAAATGTLLFLVHPVHADVVASAVGLTEQLASLFQLFALLLVLPPRAAGEEAGTGPSWTAAAGLFLLALLSKETAVAWPLLAAIALASSTGGVHRWIGRLALVSAAPLAAMLVLRHRVIGAFLKSPSVQISPLDNPLAAAGLEERLAGAVQLLLADLRLLLWPRELSADYSLGSLSLARDLGDPRVLAAAAVLLALAALAWTLRHRLPEVGWGLAFAAAALLPTSHFLFAGGALFAERFLFLPSVGVAWLAGGLAGRVLVTVRWRRAAIGGLIVVALLAAGRTVLRTADWHDDETLFRRALTVLPDNAKAHYNIAVYDFRAGRLADSEGHARRAIEIFGGYLDARVLLAELLLRRAARDEAEALLRETLDLEWASEDIFLSLGTLLTQERRLGEAVALYEEGIGRLPGSARLPHNLGLIEMELGRTERAEPLLRRALAAGIPFDAARLALSAIALGRSDFRGALAELAPLLSAPTPTPRALELAAYCHLELAEPELSLALLGRQPATPDARLLVAAALLALGDRAGAERLAATLDLSSTGACGRTSFPEHCEALSSAY